MNKKRTNTVIPGDIFHPGTFIKDELEARNMSQQNLANNLGISKSEVSLLVNGHRNITAQIAVLLEKALKIEAEFWMNLQMKYDIELARKKIQNSIKSANISKKRKNQLRDSLT